MCVHNPNDSKGFKLKLNTSCDFWVVLRCWS